MRLRFSAVLLSAFVLTGCAGGLEKGLEILDPTASPFPARRDATAAANLSIVLSATVIHVSPPRGLGDPSAQALAEQVAESLRIEGIPAMTGTPPKHARFLVGQASVLQVKQDKALVAMAWSIRGQDGNELDGFTHEAIFTVTDASDPWGTADRGELEVFARKTAGRISGSLDAQENADQIAAEKQQRASLAGRSVCFEPVSGAPGDGNDLLSQAMRFQLSMRGIANTDSAEAAGGDCPTVSGTVHIQPIEEEGEIVADEVSISWIVLDQEGHQVGTVDQVNRVAHGSLTQSWQGVAPAITGAAIGEVLGLLRRGQP